MIVQLIHCLFCPALQKEDDLAKAWPGFLKTTRFSWDLQKGLDFINTMHMQKLLQSLSSSVLCNAMRH